MIISFAWTTEAFLAGRKTRTRRLWADDHAAKFHHGDVFQAWDRVPRVGGARQIGYGRIVAPLRREHISHLTEEDFESEGFAYMEEKGKTIWGMNMREAFENWKEQNLTYWVVDFIRKAGP